MKPEITILMPVYNAEKYLVEAMDSILNQTFGEFEFLIINDGSTDKTIDIINSYSDNRIKLITRENGGVAAALNTGLQHASGIYIARFDADDICYPYRIEEQYHFLTTHPDYVLVGSDVEYIDRDGEYLFMFRNDGHTHEEIGKSISLKCPFIHSSVMYKKNSVIQLGGYEVKAHTFEDYFLWVKLIKMGKVCNLEKPMIQVRFNPESVTVDAKDYNDTFKKLHQKALKTGIITEEEGILIKQSINQLDKNKKESSYHRMLGKKYLWNNYNPQKARKHILQSLKKEPLDAISYVLLVLSFFSQKTIDSVYKRVKNNHS